MIFIHYFETTGDAYDQVQCNKRIKKGDLLWIPSEEVIGIAYTRPFAVTKNIGKLHRIAPDAAGDQIREEFAASIAEANILASILGYEF